MSESSIEHARAARARKAALLQDLSTGSISLADALTANPRALKNTTLWSVLMAARGMGPVGAAKVTTGAEVYPLKVMGGLTTKELTRIINSLPKRAK